MGTFVAPQSDSILPIHNAAEQDADTAPHVLHIDRRGVWSYGGSPFLRKEMVCLLASCLRRIPAGGYEVVLPNEPHPIPVEVEDVPFLAVELFSAGYGEDQILSFRTNVDRIISAGPETPLFLAVDPATGEDVPYISLGKGLTARISRPVFYELVALAETREDTGVEEVGVWSNRQFFVLGNLI